MRRDKVNVRVLLCVLIGTLLAWGMHLSAQGEADDWFIVVSDDEVLVFDMDGEQVRPIHRIERPQDASPQIFRIDDRETLITLADYSDVDRADRTQMPITTHYYAHDETLIHLDVSAYDPAEALYFGPYWHSDDYVILQNVNYHLIPTELSMYALDKSSGDLHPLGVNTIARLDLLRFSVHFTSPNTLRYIRDVGTETQPSAEWVERNLASGEETLLPEVPPGSFPMGHTDDGAALVFRVVERNQVQVPSYIHRLLSMDGSVQDVVTLDTQAAEFNADANVLTYRDANCTEACTLITIDLTSGATTTYELDPEQRGLWLTHAYDDGRLLVQNAQTTGWVILVPDGPPIDLGYRTNAYPDFSPDFRFVFTVLERPEPLSAVPVQVYDTETGVALPIDGTVTDNFTAVTWVTDDTFVLRLDDQQLYYDGAALIELPPLNVDSDSDFSDYWYPLPDGRWLVTGAEDVGLYDSESGTTTALLSGYTPAVLR